MSEVLTKRRQEKSEGIIDLRDRHRIAVVDIENLVGGSCCPRELVALAFDEFDAAANISDADLVFVAASRPLVFDCGCLRPAAMHYLARGVDGAELRLMAEVTVDFIVHRASELVIGSGDGRFVEYALAVREAGVPVRIVARPRSIHHRYWAHGFDITQLAPFPHQAGYEVAIAA